MDVERVERGGKNRDTMASERMSSDDSTQLGRLLLRQGKIWRGKADRRCIRDKKTDARDGLEVV